MLSVNIYLSSYISVNELDIQVHSRNRADSEYVSYVEVDHNGVEFVANKHTHSLTHSLIRIQTLNFIY